MYIYYNFIVFVCLLFCMHCSKEGCQFSLRYPFSYSLLLQFITRFKHPPHYKQASCQEQQNHRQAYPNAYIRYLKKTPAKTTNQIEYWIKKSDLLPEGRQHINRVKAATKKDQRCNYQHRNKLQFFKVICP